MKQTSSELALPNESTALASQEPSVGAMMQAIIDKGITADSVAVMERMMAMKERMDEKQAAREFAVAFADMQAELPRMIARGKADRYLYLKYEDIMHELSPLLGKHGLTVTFSMKVTEARLTQFCTVTHRGGFSRTNEYTVRLSNKTPGLNECQQDGLAGTYAKRYALCNAFNITIESDLDGVPEDARNEGAFISSDKVQYLREQIKETGSNEAKLMEIAGVKRWEDCTDAIYPVITRALAAKAKR